MIEEGVFVEVGGVRSWVEGILEGRFREELVRRRVVGWLGVGFVVFIWSS